MVKKTLLFCILLLISGCKNKNTEDGEKLWTDAQTAFSAKQYKKAIKFLADIDNYHCHEHYGKDAALMLAECHLTIGMKRHSYDHFVKAISASDFVIDSDGKYAISKGAHLLKIKAHSGMVDWDSIDTSDEFVHMTLKAIDEYKEKAEKIDMVEAYTKDLPEINKIKDRCISFLASKELQIAKYYLFDNHPRLDIPALARLNHITTEYKNSEAYPEAMYTQMEILDNMEATKEDLDQFRSEIQDYYNNHKVENTTWLAKAVDLVKKYNSGNKNG